MSGDVGSDSLHSHLEGPGEIKSAWSYSQRFNPQKEESFITLSNMERLLIIGGIRNEPLKGSIRSISVDWMLWGLALTLERHPCHFPVAQRTAEVEN